MTALLALTVGLSCPGADLKAQESAPFAAAQQARQLSATVAKTVPGTSDLATDLEAAAPLRDMRGRERGSRQQPPPILPEKFVPSHLANRAMAVMGLLIVGCIAAIWYGQRYSRTGRSRSSSSALQVLDTLSIAPRCCVHLLNVGGQKYLVARDQAGIKSVTAVNAFAATLDDLADNHVDSAHDAAMPSLTNRSWANRSDSWSSTINR
jgi:flagellar biogenesis protein FliO